MLYQKKMEIKKFTFNSFQENTYLLIDDHSRGLIIDPGNSNFRESSRIWNFMQMNLVVPYRIYNTHCHIDHIYGNVPFMNEYRLDLYIPKGEEFVMKSTPMVANMYGIPAPEIPEKYYFYDENSRIPFGDDEMEVMNIPGHSPDHMVIYHRESKSLFAGDTLFKKSIGRTDLPGGNHELLISGIKEKLFVLDDDTVVYPGHGPKTTIGYEKRNNLFLI